jgi:hypothetical protein
MRSPWLAGSLPVVLVLVAAACSEPSGPGSPSVAVGAPVFDLISGGCPDQFDLAKSAKTTADYKVVGRDPADDNQDGFRCQAITKFPVYSDDKSTLKSQGVLVLIDNNIPPNAIGKCPVTFTAVMATGVAEDANANLVTCEYHIIEEGGTETGIIVVDDNDH